MTTWISVDSAAPDPEPIAEATGILENGGVLAFPTETVYGLGALQGREDASKKLKELKDRPDDKPFTLLIADVVRDPFDGIGKPEPLRHVLSGAWSRRIDEKNRLVYYVTDDHIVILQARDHY